MPGEQEHEDLTPLERRFQRAGLPTTCGGWVVMFVIAVVVRTISGALWGHR